MCPHLIMINLLPWISFEMKFFQGHQQVQLMLPLKCANEDNFAAMKKAALNCECEEIAEFQFYFHSKISSVATRKFEIEGIPSAIFTTKATR